MADGAFQLRGAGDVFTTPRNEFRVARNRSAAGGAFAVDMLEEIELFGVARPFLLHDSDNGGDDFAGLLDDDRVADADVLALDFLLVVERGAGDRRAGEEDGLQFGDRRSVPVRPTWIVMPLSLVSACSCEYL